MNPLSEFNECWAVILSTMAFDIAIPDPDQRETFGERVQKTRTVSMQCLRKDKGSFSLTLPGSMLFSFISSDPAKDYPIRATGKLLGGSQIEWEIDQTEAGDTGRLVGSQSLASFNLKRIAGRFTTDVSALRPRHTSPACFADTPDAHRRASVTLTLAAARPRTINVDLFVSVPLLLDNEPLSLNCQATALDALGLREIELTAEIRELRDENWNNGIYPGGVARFFALLHGPYDVVYENPTIKFEWFWQPGGSGWPEIKPLGAIDKQVFELQLGTGSPQPHTGYSVPENGRIVLNITVDGLLVATEIPFIPDTPEMGARKAMVAALYRKIIESRCPPEFMTILIQFVIGLWHKLTRRK